MKNLLHNRGSLASVGSNAISRMGKSERSIYKSVVVISGREVELDCGVGAQEKVSDISTVIFLRY